MKRKSDRPWPTGRVDIRHGSALVTRFRVPDDQLRLLVETLDDLRGRVCPKITGCETATDEDVMDALICACLHTYGERI